MDEQQRKEIIKTADVAFGSGEAYSLAQQELERGIREAKRRHKQRIEEQFNNNNPRNMWKGIKALTDYKTTSHSASKDTNLPDALN